MMFLFLFLIPRGGAYRLFSDTKEKGKGKKSDLGIFNKLALVWLGLALWGVDWM
jgi:hypothetical protein